MRPTLEVNPAGGQVVVTRFECTSVRTLLAIWLSHIALRSDVRQQATGFVGVKTLVNVRQRTLLNISMWTDIESVYTLGEVRQHGFAVRLARRMGVQTTCGIFCFAGNCQSVMFGVPAAARSPFHPLSSGEMTGGVR